MNGQKPTIYDLARVRSAVHHLTEARTCLRDAKVRRAAILTAQALKAAQGAERVMNEQLTKE